VPGEAKVAQCGLLLEEERDVIRSVWMEVGAGLDKVLAALATSNAFRRWFIESEVSSILRRVLTAGVFMDFNVDCFAHSPLCQIEATST
jgi:hypothetical protein